MRANKKAIGLALAFLALGAGPGLASAAEAVVVGPETRRLLPGGKEVDAIDGDYLLVSDRIVVVVGGVAAFRDANVNTQAVQGAVIDLARRDLPGGDNDLLSAYYPMGHYLDAPGPTRAEVVRARGAEAVVRFTRPAAPGMQGDPVDAETEYRLRDGEPFLRVVTIYRNRGPKEATASVYDKIRADTLFIIPPAGDTRSVLYDEPWHGAAYGVVRAGGAPIRTYANPAKVTYFLEGGNRIDFPDLLTPAPNARPLGKSLPKPTPIPTGGEVRLERYLIPGRHPADVQAVAARLLGESLTPVPIRLTDPEGRPVAGATVRARRGAAVLSEGRTDPDGRLTLAIPGVDTFDLVMTQRGRPEAVTRVKPGSPDVGPDGLALSAGPIARAAFDVWDVTRGRSRGPVRILLRGVDGTRDPDFGPDALPFQASNLVFSADGRATVALPPGRYEATFTRGPEFTQAVRRFETFYGATAPVSAEFRRAFESPGWVIADFHNHTTASNDSIADPLGRVVGIAASGVEFAPATEHNRITSFAPYIASIGLTPYLASAGGIELSGRPGPGATNHQNAFPLTVVEHTQGNGAPMTDRDPRVQIERLYRLDGGAEKFVQQNHPDISWLYFDRNRDGTRDGGFGTLPFTHAIEVNRSIARLLADLESPGASPGAAFRWVQMLNQGDRVFATANSDAHVTKHNNGTIFTYVRSETDDPARLDPRALASAARAGRMVVSNGPFLDVTLDGLPPGSDVPALDRSPLRLTARVWCPPWFDVDRVQVLINGHPEKPLNFTRRAASPGFLDAPRALRFEREIPLEMKADAHVIVVAVGARSRLGPAAGPYADQAPTAVSNPIFIDADGGGFTASHDTLGAPLVLKAASDYQD